MGTNDDESTMTTELGPAAQALIQAGRPSLRPSADDRERVFAALATRLGFVPESTPAAPRGGAGSIGSQWVSLLPVGLAAAAFVVHAALSGGSNAAAPVAAPRVIAPAPAAAPIVVPGAVVAAPAPAATTRAANPVPSSPSLTGVGSGAPRSSSLAAEVSLLTRAETELHAGRFAAALELLDEHARLFPRGALAEERSGARIQALCGLGRFSQATTELNRLAPHSVQNAPARQACAAR